jgi:hypothetical protein
MVGKEGERTNARSKPNKLNYFFLNGNLHRRLHINRSADKIITWCYPEERRVAYTYSDVKRRKEPAFTTTEVARMLNRSRQIVEYAIMDGSIDTPQFTYGINERKKKYKYMWDEKHIIELHQYFNTKHYGRPRKDGIVNPKKMPSLRELRALIRQEEPLYVKMDNGEFLPVWRAPDFD